MTGDLHIDNYRCILIASHHPEKINDLAANQLAEGDWGDDQPHLHR